MSIRFTILPSTVHGEGLFAAEFIPAETHLGRYEGPVVSEDGPHVLWIWDDEDNLFGIDGQNELRYVNHSLEPNVEFRDADLYALRDIQPGEELFHHYGEDWVPEEDPGQDGQRRDAEVAEGRGTESAPAYGDPETASDSLSV